MGNEQIVLLKLKYSQKNPMILIIPKRSFFFLPCYFLDLSDIKVADVGMKVADVDKIGFQIFKHKHIILNGNS